MNNTTALPFTTDAINLVQNVTNTTDTESGRSMSPVRSSLQVLMCLMVFFFNILILIVISTSKGKFKVTYLFFGHLAVADLLFGFGFSLRFILLRTLPASKLFVLCIATMGMWPHPSDPLLRVYFFWLYRLTLLLNIRRHWNKRFQSNKRKQ